MLMCGLKKEALTLISQRLGKIQIEYMPYQIMYEEKKINFSQVH